MRISIVTVCLNEARTLRETCQSICQQTVQDFEWVVIDGGSTDGSLDILADYQKWMTVLVSEPDRGVYDAMNKGIERATGDYLVFLNAGDKFYSESVLERVSRTSSVDLIFGDLACQEADGNVTIKSFPETLPPDFLRHNMLPHQASFFRRGLFQEYGGYDTSYRIAGDYELFCRLLRKGNISTARIPAILAIFSIGGISSDRAYRNLRKLENHRVRKDYFPLYRFSFDGLKMALRAVKWRQD